MAFSPTDIQFAAVLQLVICLKRHPITLPPEIIQMIASTAAAIDAIEWAPELQEYGGQLYAPPGWFFVFVPYTFCIESMRAKRMSLRRRQRDEDTIK